MVGMRWSTTVRLHCIEFVLWESFPLGKVGQVSQDELLSNK